MKTDSQFRLGSILLAALLTLALIGSPALAQDAEDDAEEDEIGRAGRVFVQLGTWVAQGTGLNYFPATVPGSSDPFDTRLIQLEHGTADRVQSRVGYEFTQKAGTLVLSYYSHNDTASRTMLMPGNFIFGEILAPPSYAGVFDDGLADGFESNARTKLRDLRIDFFRPAVRSKKFNADWFVGVRRVQHVRNFRTEYFGILPDFGPVLPFPTGQLPFSDVVDMRSDYEGRGLEAGLEANLPLYKDRLSIEAGFAVAALRGSVDSSYRATTHAYADSISGAILDPADVPAAIAAGTVTQTSFQTGLNGEGISQSSFTQEVYLGIRVRAWRELAFFAGFRDIHYGDVGLDLEPEQATLINGVNVQDTTEIRRSATYEGIYLGLYYSF